MNELIVAIKEFFYRDVIYVIGGSIVFCGIYYVFLINISFANVPNQLWFLLVGMAWVTGYFIQDIASLTPFLSILPVYQPGPVVRCLYRCFTKMPWKEISNEPNTYMHLIDIEMTQPRAIARLERIVTLKHLCATVGPSCLVTSILLVYAYLQQGNYADLKISVLLAAVAIGFFALAWIKAAQQAQVEVSLSSKVITAY